MVDRVLRDEAAARFKATAPPDAFLFLNFTADNVGDPAAFARAAGELADEISLDRARMVFEATRAELSDHEDVAATLGALRDAGFAIALDGLGTGDLGPSLVRAIRPTFAKIDGRTVRAATTIPFAASLIRRLVTACAETQTKLVATGVETTEQLGVLSHANVDCFQGYLLAAPRKL
jgi:EAL domain-containing protein (putative c-di-GMP-specific phosphodiesterase class I)